MMKWQLILDLCTVAPHPHHHRPIPRPESPTMLPYHTTATAAAALGRNLTAAETIWLHYTSTTPDFYLYAHNLLFLLLTYTLAPLPLTLFSLLRPATLSHYKIQPKTLVPPPTILACYTKVVLTFILTVGPLQVFSYPVIKWVGISTSLPLPTLEAAAAQLLVYFVVEDFFNYWIHRALHSKWGYEKIHRVHHEFTAPVGFAAPYAHPAEVLILGVPAFIGPAIVPCHILVFWVWMVVRHVEAVETHCGYDFPFTPTKYIPFYGGADYHDYHHYVGSKCQSNFASVFTYCDYIYGTDKGYRYQKECLEEIREKWRANEDNEEVKDIRGKHD